jgi:hypothetical protein
MHIWIFVLRLVAARIPSSLCVHAFAFSRAARTSPYKLTRRIDTLALHAQAFLRLYNLHLKNSKKINTRMLC